MKCYDCRTRTLKTSQAFFGLIDIVGPVTARVSREYMAIQCPRFYRLFSLRHHRRSPEGAGNCKRLRIYRCSDWLARHMQSPYLRPGRRLNLRLRHHFKPLDDQRYRCGIGAGKARLIVLPQRHGRELSPLGRPFKQRHTLAATKKHNEQTHGPTHAHLSAMYVRPYRLMNNTMGLKY